MSSSSDQVVFAESIAPQDSTNLFQEKKWTNIVDSSSNGGVFNGQIQFDLNTLSSQNQWSDLSQAIIQFPVKFSVKSTISTTNTAANSAFGDYSATIKNGFHNFVDSVQITLGGTTVQSSQIFENINTTFKMLTDWSSDEYKKFGPSLGLGLDDFQITSDASASAYGGLDNVALSTITNARGVHYPIDRNPGLKERLNFLNSSTTSTSAATTILGNNAAPLGKSRVQGSSITAGTINPGQDLFVGFALATIRLKDISDICSKLPLMKQMKGFVYVNYNAAQTAFTGASALPTSGLASSSLYGRCQPGSLNAFTVTSMPLLFTCEVSGVKSTTIPGPAPAFNNARLFCPYYVASPEVDRALSMKKTIRFHERFTTSFSIAANDNVNLTISPGITNPKRVILYPISTRGATGDLATYLDNPLLSPWDSVPSTTSPFAALQNLQLTVGGKQMWQSPVSMDYEQFLQETSQRGLDGSMVSETTSNGILNQRLWNQMYRYYTCDVSRRMGADDGASKAVQLSATNATGAPMTVIAMVLYEREIIVDTAMGQITQSM